MSEREWHHSSECYDCGEAFTFLFRRHHCRECCRSFCNEHSLPMQTENMGGKLHAVKGSDDHHSDRDRDRGRGALRLCRECASALRANARYAAATGKREEDEHASTPTEADGERTEFQFSSLMDYSTAEQLQSSVGESVNESVKWLGQNLIGVDGGNEGAKISLVTDQDPTDADGRTSFVESVLEGIDFDTFPHDQVDGMLGSVSEAMAGAADSVTEAVLESVFEVSIDAAPSSQESRRHSSPRFLWQQRRLRQRQMMESDDGVTDAVVDGECSASVDMSMSMSMGTGMGVGGVGDMSMEWIRSMGGADTSALETSSSSSVDGYTDMLLEDGGLGLAWEESNACYHADCRSRKDGGLFTLLQRRHHCRACRRSYW